MVASEMVVEVMVVVLVVLMVLMGVVETRLHTDVWQRTSKYPCTWTGGASIQYQGRRTEDFAWPNLTSTQCC